MKRLSLLGLLALGMSLLTGCPIFDENGQGAGCWDNCGDPGGGAPTTTTTNPNACLGPADCTGINETCGSDGECHTGDCTLVGCVSGFSCRIGEDMKAHCIEGTGTGGAPGTGGAASGGAPGTGGSGGVSSGGSGGAPGTGGAATTGSGGSGGTGGAPGTGGGTSSTGTGGTGGN